MGVVLPASAGNMIVRAVTQREANEGNVTHYYAFDRFTVSSDSAEATIIDYDRINDMTLFSVVVSMSHVDDSWHTDSVRVDGDWPYASPPAEPVEYTYGTQIPLAFATSGWARDRASQLLAPTWLPEGLSPTEVYLCRADPSTGTGPVEQVTFLYSYKGTSDPRAAELTVRACSILDLPWLVPRDEEGIGPAGNSTTVGGHSAYVGSLKWNEVEFNRLYGGSARFVSVVEGDQIYLIRGPIGFSYDQLLQIAASLQPVS